MPWAPVDALAQTMLVLGLVILGFGMAKFLYVPLALLFAVGQRRARRRGSWTLLEERPLVSVIVPGYNEEAVIENCVHSIARSDYDLLEVILVDDGSTDRTPALMAELAAQYPQVRFIAQPNQGKGAALNTGTDASTGDVLMYVDADGIYETHTVQRMLEGFNHPNVGAVCGDDRPVNLNRVQTRLLTVISHVGTGLVRRALTVLRCLPIVSGNAGAFRREVLQATGPLRTDTVGEDLELTWRVHQAGYRVNFAPRALVHAESPSTLRGLWNQRVRWARGLLQTLAIHRRLVGNLRYGAFGAYLAFNAVTMVLIPVIQLLVLALIPFLLLAGLDPLPAGVAATLGWLGLIVAVVLCVYAMALNRSLADTRHLWTLPLWPLYSVFVGLTMVSALWHEARRSPARWNKLERTGVVSIGALRGHEQEVAA